MKVLASMPKATFTRAAGESKFFLSGGLAYLLFSHTKEVRQVREHKRSQVVVRGRKRSCEVVRGHKRSYEVVRSRKRS